MGRSCEARLLFRGLRVLHRRDGQGSKRRADVVWVGGVQAEAPDHDAEKMSKSRKCSYLACCFSQAKKTRGVHVSVLVHWDQTARWCQDGRRPCQGTHGRVHRLV